MDDAPETMRQAATTPAGGKVRLHALQVLEGAPEQLFGHRGVASLARMRHTVATRGRRAADARQPADVMTQRIAHVVESDRVGHLRIQQRHHMAPRAERTRHRFHAGLARQLRHHMARDQVAKLREDRELAPGWSWSPIGFLFHTRSLTRAAKPRPAPTAFPSFPVGRLCCCSHLYSERLRVRHAAASLRLRARLSIAAEVTGVDLHALVRCFIHSNRNWYIFDW